MIILFSMTLKHRYFDQGKWFNARVVPDDVTGKWMTRLGLTLVSKGNVWRLCGFNRGNRDALITYLTSQVQGFCFHFWILQPLSNFVWFTDLPNGFRGVLHATSQNAQATSDGVALHILGCDTVANVPRQAVVKLMLFAEDLLQTPSYELQLRQRFLKWQYCLIQRGQRILNAPEIIDEEGKVVFSQVKKIAVEKVANTSKLHTESSGDIAWLIESDAPLPLQEDPTQRLKLIDKQIMDVQTGRTAQRVVLSILPAPQAEEASIVKQDDQTLLSKIYVYV